MSVSPFLVSPALGALVGAGIGARLFRKAENLFADDAALHLAGAGVDRAGAVILDRANAAGARRLSGVGGNQLEGFVVIEYRVVDDGGSDQQSGLGAF